MNRVLIADDGTMRTFMVLDGDGNQIGVDQQLIGFPPLVGHQINAALNAALGIWTLQDAANAAGTSPSHLVAEVQAWAAAQG